MRAPRTRKPGESAQVDSTQGSSPAFFHFTDQAVRAQLGLSVSRAASELCAAKPSNRGDIYTAAHTVAAVKIAARKTTL